MPSLLTLLTLLLPLFAHAGESFTTGYRILHTSPQEVMSALTSPQPRKVPRSAGDTQRGRVASRMQKYFRIRNKTFEGRSIILQLAPEVPLLGEEFSDVNLITLKFTEIERRENKFVYALKIAVNPDKFLDTTMTLEPHVSGSLLTLRLDKPSLLSKTFSRVALALGFLEPSQQAAEAKDR